MLFRCHAPQLTRTGRAGARYLYRFGFALCGPEERHVILVRFNTLLPFFASPDSPERAQGLAQSYFGNIDVGMARRGLCSVGRGRCASGQRLRQSHANWMRPRRLGEDRWLDELMTRIDAVYSFALSGVSKPSSRLYTPPLPPSPSLAGSPSKMTVQVICIRESHNQLECPERRPKGDCQLTSSRYLLLSGAGMLSKTET